MEIEYSVESIDDLEDVTLFGQERFGWEQASRYFDRMTDAIERLGSIPHLDRADNRLPLQLRWLAVGEHRVVYAISRDRLVIRRILHHRVDSSTLDWEGQ